ncbi:MAG: hypothetical protein AMXMBFR33_02090 [Candidatus Xenobia bacterium]
MDQQQRRRLTDILYLGGATIAAVSVGLLMRGSPEPLAASTHSPSPTPSATASHTPVPSPVQIAPEPDNCPACGMAVRVHRDQDFIERTQKIQQEKPSKP